MKPCLNTKETLSNNAINSEEKLKKKIKMLQMITIDFVTCHIHSIASHFYHTAAGIPVLKF